MKVNLRSAIEAIDRQQILLVFSIKNKSEVPSLWSQFYPRSKMKWEWDEGGDNRVADLWHLREELSSSGKVIYAKWFQGRATVISKKIFPALLRALNTFEDSAEEFSLSPPAQDLLLALEENSPLSTKELKKISGLKGRTMESSYHSALSELWRRLLIVGSGEVDDGAFPSLAISATKIFFEDEWQQAQKLSTEKALAQIEKFLGPESPFFKFLRRIQAKNVTETTVREKRARAQQARKRRGLRFQDL